VAVAVLLFTRFGFSGTLSRDEAVYAYGGQQLASGLAPYASVFDPKTPMATLLAGVAALLARVSGLDDVAVIRAVYFLCTCLTVLATYLLATRLWESRVAGVTAAVVLASFRGFAMDAASGPNAKTPGLLLFLVCMLLVLDRRWFLAALCGSCAFLVWQPLAFYPALVVLLAAATSGSAARRRAVGAAVAGAVLPVLLTVAAFAVVGALSLLVEATVLFPLQGISRGTETLPERLLRIAEVVTVYYGPSGVLVWVGVVVLLGIAGARLRRRPLREALRDPVVCVVSATLLVQLAYATTDFQSYPDVFPFLPYAAIGIAGGTTTLAARWEPAGAGSRRAVPAVALGLVALTVFSAVSFTRDPSNNDGLRLQRLQACALDRVLPRDAPLYAVGDPTALVLTRRRNVDRFILVSSGLAEWKMGRLRDAFDGWMAQVERADPWVVTTSRVPNDLNVSINLWLRQHGYHRFYVGRWRVFVDRRGLDRALEEGVGLRRFRSLVPTTPAAQGGRPLTSAICH
jgi:hypothetical protein